MYRRFIALTLFSLLAPLYSASAECPLPDGGVLQLEWISVQDGWHRALFEVIGPREGEPGAWNDAIHDEDGGLVWAGVLRCEGAMVVLQADYDPETGRMRRFSPAVPWWGESSRPASSEGIVIAGADVFGYQAAALGGQSENGSRWIATQVERVNTDGTVELLWAADSWIDPESGLPESRRLEWRGEAPVHLQRVGVSRPVAAAVVAVPALGEGQALAEARR